MRVLAVEVNGTYSFLLSWMFIQINYQFGFHIELAPIIGESGLLTRRLRIIRYRFKDKRD